MASVKFLRHFKKTSVVLISVIAVCSLSSERLGAEESIDTTRYHVDREFSGPESLGGKKGIFLPEEKFVFEDRQQFVPIEEDFYIVGDDGLCYTGVYHLDGEVKKLELDKTSVVASTKCIYQKKFSEQPSGFSLFSKEGGVCKPTYATSTTELEHHPDRARKVINKAVAIYHCIEGTVSYGEALEKSSRNTASEEEAAGERPVSQPPPSTEVKKKVIQSPRPHLQPNPELQANPL